VKIARLVFLICCPAIFGCSAINFATPEGPPYTNDIYAGYRQVQLKTSTSADALTAIVRDANELVSQSKSVIAAAGAKKRGNKRWFKMVAFDENELIARRKYVFIVDERPKTLFVEPWESVDFDCQMVLDNDVLSEPYASENARRVAILKRVSQDTRKDVSEVGTDNKALEVNGMIVNQALATVLTDLDASPVLASKLSEPRGLGFEHTSFDKGLIWMTVEGDIVTIKLRLGSAAKKPKVTLEQEPKS